MTDCSKVKGFLNKYFKDELDKKKRLYVEAHVKNCIMCSAEMEFAKKRLSVSELLNSLQPQPSFFKRIANSPQKTKQRIKKKFSKHPVVLPIALIVLFLFIPAGLYVKRNSIQSIKTDESKEIVQAVEEIKKPSITVEKEKKTASANLVNPAQTKHEEKAVKPEIMKQDVKVEQKAIDKPKEAVKKEDKVIAVSAKAAPLAAIKKEEKIEMKEDNVSAKAVAPVEIKEEAQKLSPNLYRLKLKSDLLPDAIFTKIDSLSENSGAVIISSKGFTPDSTDKKEIVVRLSKEKYEGFLKEMKNQFNDISAMKDKNIKLSNDISKQEGQSFVLIEVN